MDVMDMDKVHDIPDTPDRLSAQNIKDRGCIKKESDSSVAIHSGNTNFVDEGARNQLRGSSSTKPVLGNGHNRRLSFRSGKNLSVSNNSEGDGDITISVGNPSFSRNGHLFRKTVADKITYHKNKYSLNYQCTEKGKALSTSQLPSCGQKSIVDLTEQSGSARLFHNPIPNGALDDRQTKEIMKIPISTDGFSFLRGIENSSMTAHNACKGKEKIDNTCKGGSDLDHGNGVFDDSQPKDGKSMSSSFYSIPPPRVSRQKKLVQNGCIGPHGTAKAKQLAENCHNGSMNVQKARGTLASDLSLSPIRDLIAEDNNFHRQETISCHSSLKVPDAKTIDLATSCRSSITRNEEASGTSNASGDPFKCFEGLGGLSSTHNHGKKIDLPLSDEGQTKDQSCFANQQNENKVVRRDNGNGSNDHHEDRNAVSFHHGSALTVAQAVPRPMSQSVRVSGRRAAASTHIKRQKQGSASSNYGESSTSASVDSEIMFLGSLGEPSNSKSTGNHSGHGPGIFDSVIEIDEFSPEMKHFGSHNMGFCSNDDSYDRARQVEADEMLARELQEQLYNEAPGVEVGEIDAHMASALQLEETSQHEHSSGSYPVFHPRDSLISNLYRQSLSRSSRNPSIRRGTTARGPASARLAQLRSRFLSQLPRMSYRESSSLFPSNMDLDTRIHILEALEAFSDMGMAGNFPQVEREFNENDYEMLLALDENNHQHGGASLDQINSLPQSRVQGDNFEEACAICLETPTPGDTIRHLPCLHKFHKDCIDPWLRRRTSCPICKSSIT